MKRKKYLYAVLVLCLFFVFAGCIMAVLLSGAEVYQKIVARDQEAYQQRTAVQYISNRVRQVPGPGRVTVESFSGLNCLCIRESIEGTEYVTRIYCFDGWMRELFTGTAGSFSGEDGEKVLPAQALSFVLEGSLLRAELTEPEGGVTRWALTLRQEEGAEYAK